MANKNPDPLTRRESVNLYYSILRGGARIQLLEAAINLNIFELLDKKGPLLETNIIRELEIVPKRGKKWLFLLYREQFLNRKKTPQGYEYSLGLIPQNLFEGKEKLWWWFKQMTYSWQTIAYENLTEVLQGKTVSFNPTWPPKHEMESDSLEEWMTNTSHGLINCMAKAVDFDTIDSLLDVGGGEATIACELAKRHSNISITVYNLPRSIALATDNIQKHNLQHRVKTHAGNFLEDEAFPPNYDAVLFSRVLCDWSPETCKKLLTMAYHALKKGGQLIITEAFYEDNHDFSVGWEFRYIFWDDFEAETFKSSLTYTKILQDIGFEVTKITSVTDDTIYSILLAEK